MKHILLVVLALFCAFQTFPQGQKLKLEGELLFHSRHVWRGMKFGENITAEPSVTVSKGRFSFNVWAAKTLDDSYAEIDLIPSFKLNNYEISLLDYYNPVGGADNNYFHLNSERNRHSTELAISRQRTARLPIRFMLATFFFGDKNQATDNPYFSTYIEAAIPFTLAHIRVEPVAGLTTHEGYYADRFALINTGISIRKEFKINANHTIPLRLLAVTNPYKNQTHFTLMTGITVH